MNFLQWISRIDVTIYHFLGGFAGNWFLDRIVNQLEINNLLRGVPLFAMYWYLWFRNDPEQKGRRLSIISILIGAVLTILVDRTIAYSVPFRIRPMYDPTIVHSLYSVRMEPNLENWSAFPSDTAAYFFALAFGLGHLLRPLKVALLLYVGVFVALPRMYMGVHWASDIVVGSVIGITTVWVLLRNDLLQWIAAKHIIPAMERKPEWFYSIAFLASFEMAGLFENCRRLGRAVLHLAAVVLHVGVFQEGSRTLSAELVGFITIAGLLTATVCVASLVTWKLQRTGRLLKK